MLDLRPIFLVIGLLLTTLATAMVLPAAVDALAANPDWSVFAAAGAVTLFVGLATVMASRAGTIRLSVRQTFLLTALAWFAAASVSALPFYFSDLQLSLTDAFFEAMSGITTTGSTVMVDLDAAPPGILLWRAVLQWLGGIGVIIMAVAVLPVLHIGGMEMFRVESSGRTETMMPRAASLTSAISVLYVALTALLAGGLWLAGMSGFDALVHAMTTISTGGFSTSDASIGRFDSAGVEMVILLGMVASGMPFLVLLQVARGKVWLLGWESQLRWYFTILAVSAAAVALWMWIDLDAAPLRALRHGTFTVVSVMTGTGFFTGDFSAWYGLPVAVLFFLTLVGGCAGSTSGGIKVFRIHVLVANARVQAAKLLGPHAIHMPYYNRKPIDDAVSESVMGFLFVYVLALAVLAMALALLGLDFMTALSGAASALANVGPGLGGTIGAGGNYAGLPDIAKWLLAGGMLLGRLEMFVILVLFVPGFWRG